MNLDPRNIVPRLPSCGGDIAIDLRCVHINLRLNGAGEGNRTLVCSLGSCRSTIELHPLCPGREDALAPRGDSTSSPPDAIDRPVMRQITRWKSARFRVGEFIPYPPHYREAFAFSIILYPLQQQITLRSSLSARQARRRIGLTVFRTSNRVGKVPPFRR